MGRNKLKESQQSGNITFPRLTVDLRLRVRENVKGVIGFEYYDKEKEERAFIDKPIEGIFIGAVNVLNVFDQSYGRNGGVYSSSFFLSNKDRIAIFDPSGSKVFAGTRDEIDIWASNENIEKFKIKKHIIVLTESGSVVDVETNMILFIDQFNQFDNDAFQDYIIRLTPEEFDVDENKIGVAKKALDFLGKFARKNKPKFVNISKGKTLNDELWDEMNGDEAADMFIEWKKSIEETGAATESTEPEPEGEEESMDTVDSPTLKAAQEKIDNEFTGVPEGNVNDLPF